MPSLFDKTPSFRIFEKALQSLAYTQSLWTVFTDFLDYCLILMRWWDVNESMFDELRKRYPEKTQQQLLAEAFYAMGLVAGGIPSPEKDKPESPQKGFIDPFGNYFMEHFSSDHAGQFFTPEPVCEFMTQLTAAGMKDGETICDPCCGSGRLLLGAAKINRKLKFYAADIDLTCVKMTLINFMLNTMPGEVAHMDSMKREVWRAYKVSLIPCDGHFLPMYMELQPHQSVFYTSPPPPKIKTAMEAMADECIVEKPREKNNKPIIITRPASTDKPAQLNLFDP